MTTRVLQKLVNILQKLQRWIEWRLILGSKVEKAYVKAMDDPTNDNLESALEMFSDRGKLIPDGSAMETLVRITNQVRTISSIPVGFGYRQSIRIPEL